jgi:hypothetical protein
MNFEAKCAVFSAELASSPSQRMMRVRSGFIYSKRSKLLVVFIGADYQRKMWPGIEWNAIRSVLTTAKANGRIMYVRMDEGDVEGIFPHDGYIDARRFSPSQIAAFIAERVEFSNSK